MTTSDDQPQDQPQGQPQGPPQGPPPGPPAEGAGQWPADPVEPRYPAAGPPAPDRPGPNLAKSPGPGGFPPPATPAYDPSQASPTYGAPPYGSPSYGAPPSGGQGWGPPPGGGGGGASAPGGWSSGPGWQPPSADQVQREAKGFLGALFDFSFTYFVTPMIIKVVYVIATVALVLGWLVFLLAGFTQSVGLGLFVLILGPLFVVLYLALVRMTLEFYLAVVRMSEDIHLRLK